MRTWTWAVPVAVTERIYVLVHAETAHEAWEKAARKQWSDTVPRGEITDWEVAGPPERQKQ